MLIAGILRAQDTCFEVRDGYLRKLLHYLRLNRLHTATLPFFHMSLFLIAHEPEEDLKVQIIQFIKLRSRRPDRKYRELAAFLSGPPYIDVFLHRSSELGTPVSPPYLDPRSSP